MDQSDSLDSYCSINLLISSMSMSRLLSPCPLSKRLRLLIRSPKALSGTQSAAPSDKEAVAMAEAGAVEAMEAAAVSGMVLGILESTTALDLVWWEMCWCEAVEIIDKNKGADVCVFIVGQRGVDKPGRPPNAHRCP